MSDISIFYAYHFVLLALAWMIKRCFSMRAKQKSYHNCYLTLSLENLHQMMSHPNTIRYLAKHNKNLNLDGTTCRQLSRSCAVALK